MTLFYAARNASDWINVVFQKHTRGPYGPARAAPPPGAPRSAPRGGADPGTQPAAASAGSVLQAVVEC